MRNAKKIIQNRSNLSLIPEGNAHLEKTKQSEVTGQQYQSKLYNKIKSFIIKSNNRKSLLKLPKKKDRNRSTGSIQVLVRSEQQKQLMQYLGPRVLPILVDSPNSKEKQHSNHKKFRSQSTLDNILNDRQKFMKTYFADLRDYKRHGNHQQISYIFPEVRQGAWKIAGYIKGKFVLLKADHKKGKSIIKKYLYSDVYKQIRKNYEKWVKDHFYIQLQLN